MTPREAIIAYAAQCREAISRRDPRPRYKGPSLVNADLCGVDLRGALLYRVELRGAVLTGAVTDCGVIVRYDAGIDGGYCWHAYTTDRGITWLQYGCDGTIIDEWLKRGSWYGRRYLHPSKHWAIGPAIAIAAAIRLRDGSSA